jgi:serine/arginine repetitive matrix protein 1
MSLGSFYRGTTIEQDGRFKNKEKKLFENINIPEFDTSIDIKKIEMKVIKDWIDRRIKLILGFEDEFCVNYTYTMLEDGTEPKKIFYHLLGKLNECFNKFFYIKLGFLNNETPNFMKQLWKLLISGQDSKNGIVKKI